MRAFLVAVAFSVAGSVAAQQLPPQPDYSGAYFCKITASGGLRLNQQTQTWAPTSFDVSESAYTVKVTKTGETTKTAFDGDVPTYYVSVSEFGSTQKANHCFGLFGSDFREREKIVFGDGGHMECRFIGSTYLINLKTMRMQVNFNGGYMDDWKENHDTPFIAVGKCDKVG